LRAIEASLSLWLEVKYLKNSFFSMKDLFYLKFLLIIEETAFLKVYLSINQRNEGLRALIDADRGAE